MSLTPSQRAAAAITHYIRVRNNHPYHVARRPRLLNEAELRARCESAGRTCATQAGCTCHPMSAYQPVAAPDQPPPVTMPDDLGERHSPPTEPQAYQPMRMLALAVVLVLVGWVIAELIALFRGQT